MARSEICPRCCPSGGAIFRADFVDFGWQSKVCQNCGFVKKPRAPKVKPSFKQIMDDPSADPAKLNRFELAKFHYFNPSGVYAEWKALGDEICAAMDAGLVKGGFWAVYGPNGYHYSQLVKLATSKSFKVWSLNYTIGKIRETITEGRAKLAEAKGN